MALQHHVHALLLLPLPLPRVQPPQPTIPHDEHVQEDGLPPADALPKRRGGREGDRDLFFSLSGG